MDIGLFANSFPTLPKSVHSPIDRTQVEDATSSIRETWKKKMVRMGFTSLIRHESSSMTSREKGTSIATHLRGPEGTIGPIE